MNLARKFKKIMSRLDPWYEKDMPEWIWNDAVRYYFNVSYVMNFFKHDWHAVHGEKKMTNMIDDYDMWVKAFEQSDLGNKSDVEEIMSSLNDDVSELIHVLKKSYAMYKKLAVALDDAPLGAVPFPDSTEYYDDIIIEPDTSLEKQLKRDLDGHYGGSTSILKKKNTLGVIKKLDKSQAYGDTFSAPVGKRVYRGITVNRKTLRALLGKNMPKVLKARQTIKVSNVIVKQKGFGSWSTKLYVANAFLARDLDADIGIIFSVNIDAKNKSSFVMNPHTSEKFSGYGEHETIQVKPVRVDSITIMSS